MATSTSGTACWQDMSGCRIYFNPKGGKPGIKYPDGVPIDHTEFPKDWFEGLDKEFYLARRYLASRNKYGVSSGRGNTTIHGLAQVQASGNSNQPVLCVQSLCLVLSPHRRENPFLELSAWWCRRGSPLSMAPMKPATWVACAGEGRTGPGCLGVKWLDQRPGSPG